MTNDELKHKLTKIAFCDDGYKRVCLVNELEEELIKDLEVLEDIKEELGIDLVTLFKALTDGICVIEENDKYIVYDEIETLSIHDRFFTTYDEYRYIFFKDYGKTWALTVEELQDDE